MTAASTSTHRPRPKRAWRSIQGAGIYIALSAALALTAMLVGWLWLGALESNKTAFELEANNLATKAEAVTDVMFVRIKDLVMYVEAGQEDKVAEKLRSASRTSPHIIDLGYFASDGTSQRSFLWGDGALGEALSEREKIARAVAGRPGLITVLPAEANKALFPKAKKNDLIFAQSGLRATPGQPIKVYYGVLSLSGLAAELNLTGDKATLVNIKSEIDGFEVNWQTHYESSPVENYFKDKKDISLSFTRRFKPTFTFYSSAEHAWPLAVLSAGLLGIFLLIAFAVALNQRALRSKRRRLQDALMAAEEASHAKDVFLANMSHEIRTPLNGILGMAELMERTEISEQQARYLGQITSSGSSLLAILNDILDMSKIKSGMISIDPVRTDLHELIQDVGTFYSSQATLKGDSLLIELDPTVPKHAKVDPTRVRQVLGNLVSNAIKFTDNGEITIQAKYNALANSLGILEVSIVDNGLGISPEDQESLFERFTQAKSSAAANKGGTGLGLAICFELCARMGGKVSCQSALGSGSTFTASFQVEACSSETHQHSDTRTVGIITPSTSVARIVTQALSQASARGVVFESFAAFMERMRSEPAPFAGLFIDEARDVHGAVDGWLTIKTAFGDQAPAWAVLLGDRQAHRAYPNFDRVLVKPFLPELIVRATNELGGAGVGATAAPEQRAASAPAATYGGRKVLLVDDNEVNLIVAEEMLQDFGFDVTIARDGQKAIAAALADRFELIFMDCRMPVMDGFEATQALRSLMESGQVPSATIIALTANALKGDREACLAAGMDNFLSKPIRKRDLANLFRGMGLEPAPVVTAPNSRNNDEPKAPPHVQIGDQTRPASDAVKPATAAPISPASTQSLPSSRESPEARPQAPSPASVAPGDQERRRVPLFDPAAFDEARATIRAFNTLLTVYREDTSEHLANLQRALSLGDLSDAILPAHTIKSGSRMVGAVGLAALAEALETRLRTGEGADPQSLETLRLRMGKAFEATLTEIDRRSLAA